MKNIVYYNELSAAIKKAINDVFTQRAPEIISFPFKGKHMKGFFFLWDNINYLVIKSEVVKNGNTTLELDYSMQRS
jgi:hypothetical protein